MRFRLDPKLVAVIWLASISLSPATTVDWMRPTDDWDITREKTKMMMDCWTDLSTTPKPPTLPTKIEQSSALYEKEKNLKDCNIVDSTTKPTPSEQTASGDNTEEVTPTIQDSTQETSTPIPQDSAVAETTSIDKEETDESTTIPETTDTEKIYEATPTPDGRKTKTTEKASTPTTPKPTQTLPKNISMASPKEADTNRPTTTPTKAQTVTPTLPANATSAETTTKGTSTKQTTVTLEDILKMSTTGAIKKESTSETKKSDETKGTTTSKKVSSTTTEGGHPSTSRTPSTPFTSTPTESTPTTSPTKGTKKPTTVTTSPTPRTSPAPTMEVPAPLTTPKTEDQVEKPTTTPAPLPLTTSEATTSTKTTTSEATTRMTTETKPSTFTPKPTKEIDIATTTTDAKKPMKTTTEEKKTAVTEKPDSKSSPSTVSTTTAKKTSKRPITTTTKGAETTKAKRTTGAPLKETKSSTVKNTSTKKEGQEMKTTTETPKTTAERLETEAISCDILCPNGTFAGEYNCYLHVDIENQTRNMISALTYCQHFGDNFNLATYNDFDNDRLAIRKYLKTVNLTTPMFHLGRESFIAGQGKDKDFTMTEMFNVTLYVQRVQVRVDVHQKGANALCKIGQSCKNLPCNMRDVYDAMGIKVQPYESLERTTFYHGEKMRINCTFPCETILELECTTRGQIRPKPHNLDCKIPDWYHIQVPTPRNGPVRKSCSEEGGFKCVCHPGWYTYTCWKSPNMCASEPGKSFCQNGATCVSMVDTVFCNCTRPWIGTRCTINGKKMSWSGHSDTISYVTCPSAASMIMLLGIGTLMILKDIYHVTDEKPTEKHNPQRGFLYIRNGTMFMVAVFLTFFGRPGIFFEYDIQCRLFMLMGYYLAVFSMGFLYFEAQNVLYVISETTTEYWCTDYAGRWRWYLHPYWRFGMPMIGAYIVTGFVSWFGWEDFRLTNSCAGLSLFEENAQIYWFMVTPLQALVVGTWWWAYYTEHQLCPAVFFSILFVVVNLLQTIVTRDELLEEVMRKFLPMFPNFSLWPTLSPRFQLNHEEIMALHTGKKVKGAENWPFHPSVEDYISEDTRNHYWREMTAYYLKLRCTGMPVSDAVFKTTKRSDDDNAGPHSEAKQMQYLVMEWARQVRIWDKYKLRIDRTIPKTSTEKLKKEMNKQQLSRVQINEDNRIINRLWKIRQALVYRPVKSTPIYTLYESETDKDLLEWGQFKADCEPARLRYQLPFFREKYARVCENFKELFRTKPDHPWTKLHNSDFRRGFTGKSKDPSPYRLPGAADFLELAYYDEWFADFQWKQLERAHEKHKFQAWEAGLDEEGKKVWELEKAEKERIKKMEAEWEATEYDDSDKYVEERWEALERERHGHRHWLPKKRRPCEPYDSNTLYCENTPERGPDGERPLLTDRESNARKRRNRAIFEAEYGKFI